MSAMKTGRLGFSLLVIWVLLPRAEVRAAIPVRVDPRIELMTAIQLLAGYEVISQIDCAYRRDVLAYFSPYRHHRAVRLFAEMSRQRFTYDAVPAAFLALSDPPALRLLSVPDRGTLDRAGGRDSLQAFYTAVRDFARVSRFMDFFKAHTTFYEQLVSDVPGGIDAAAAALESYSGVAFDSAVVVLAPLLHSGGYGATVYRQDGSFSIYALIGPSGASNDIPVWNTPHGFAVDVVHELAHSVVNPLTAHYKKRTSALERLHPPLTGRMYAAAYNNWRVVFDEHVVRAVTVRVLSALAGMEEAKILERDERQLGFAYLPVILEALREYEQNRQRYRKLEAFYPKLFDALETLTDDEISGLLVDWSINGIARDKEAIVFIVPTGERLEVLNRTIRQYTSMIRDQLFPKAPVLTDEEALEMNLALRTPIVYGTMTGNRWLARRVHDFSFGIYPDSIVSDTTFIGTDLRIITTWPNPDNPNRAILIYTAQRAEEINGAHGVYHGETEYVVARERRVLRAADYPRAGRHGRPGPFTSAD